MRDTKSLLLLLVSLLLVLVSFVLIWTWGYNYYTNNSTKQKTVVNPVSVSDKVRDSLQNVYYATLRDMDKEFDSTMVYSDSLNKELDIKLAEFYRLRNEIAAILKNRNTNNDFKVARQKITELQNKAEDLKTKNQVVDNENKKLTNILNEINDPGQPVVKNVKAVNGGSSNVEEKATPLYSVFTTSNLSLSALSVSDGNEVETSAAAKINKFIGAATVVNFNSQLSNAEIMVVILTPEGRVLKTSSWDTGTFNTPEGKKIYSYKFNFSYSKGDPKRLQFSIKTGTLAKGNYTMEIYHNGLVIGKLVKALS